MANYKIYDGTACDDQDESTIDDVCRSGTCVGSGMCDDVVCERPDSCHLKSKCENGICQNQPKVDGTRCDDGDKSTQTDQCWDGTCMGKVPKCENCRLSDFSLSIQQCTMEYLCTAKDEPPYPGRQSRDKLGFQVSGMPDRRSNGLYSPFYGQSPEVAIDGDFIHSLDSGRDHFLYYAKGSASWILYSRTTLKTYFSNSLGEWVDQRKKLIPGIIVKQKWSAIEWKPYPGICELVPLRDNTPCDDGLQETVEDKCISGKCLGTNKCDFVTCVASEEEKKNDCKSQELTCSSDSGTCQRANNKDGTSCTDGNPETFEDRCVAGICIGYNPCDKLKCLPTEQCMMAGEPTLIGRECECARSQETVSDNTPCDDGREFTENDRCVKGTCYGSQIACFGIEEKRKKLKVGQCKKLECRYNRIELVSKPDETVCNDENEQTTNDKCIDGECKGLDICKNVVCSNSLPCISLECFQGQCIERKSTNGSPCDDNDPTTDNDVCVDGKCLGADIDCEIYFDSAQCKPVMVDGYINDCRAVELQINVNEEFGPVGECVCKNPAKPDNTPCVIHSTNSSGLCMNGICHIQDECVLRGIMCQKPHEQCHRANTKPICQIKPGDPIYEGNEPCSYTAVKDGTACITDDISKLGHCENGRCIETPVCFGKCTQAEPCKINKACVPDASAPKGFRCVSEDAPEGTLCVIGNQSAPKHFYCSRGTCMDPCMGTSLQCPEPPECYDLSVPTANTGSCYCPEQPSEDGSPCDDGKRNTFEDTCLKGVCAGKNPCDRKEKMNPCIRHEVQSDNTCIEIKKTFGASCDDGNAATYSDRCLSRGCVGYDPCAPEIDAVILFEGSRSVSQADFIFQVAFIRKLASSLKVKRTGPTNRVEGRARVSALQYSDDVTPVLQEGQYVDNLEKVEDLFVTAYEENGRLRQSKGNEARAAAALTWTVENVFPKARRDFDQSPLVVLVVSTPSDTENLLEAGHKVATSGGSLHIISVGMEEGSPDDVLLQSMATSKDFELQASGFYERISRFSDLEAVAERIAIDLDRACDKAKSLSQEAIFVPTTSVITTTLSNGVTTEDPKVSTTVEIAGTSSEVAQCEKDLKSLKRQKVQANRDKGSRKEEFQKCKNQKIKNCKASKDAFKIALKIFQDLIRQEKKKSKECEEYKKKYED
eukprot:UC4_evm2s235